MKFLKEETEFLPPYQAHLHKRPLQFSESVEKWLFQNQMENRAKVGVFYTTLYMHRNKLLLTPHSTARAEL